FASLRTKIGRVVAKESASTSLDNDRKVVTTTPCDSHRRIILLIGPKPSPQLARHCSAIASIEIDRSEAWISYLGNLSLESKYSVKRLMYSPRAITTCFVATFVDFKLLKWIWSSCNTGFTSVNNSSGTLK